ncbi:MAG: ABC transporter substrate-binding protein [Thermoplasmatales archaeon]
MKRSIVAIIVVVVVIIVIGSGLGVYVLNQKTPSTPNTLVVEEPEPYDSLDPAVTFTTPGWEIMNQVYQGLVAPNGTSETSFVPVLASNWSVSSNGMNYTFFLRHNVTFSNGDPFNAYVMWFSLYRNMILNQAPEFILGQNLATNNTATNDTFNITASILNNINYTNPSSASLVIMNNPNQSVQVVNPYELKIHMGWGYNGYLPFNQFLMTLTTPMAVAVDPNVVLSHGKVVAGQTNSYMAGNATGTGFYKIRSITPGQSISLEINSNYWGYKLPSTQLNDAISPPHIKYIVIEYKQPSAMISDLQGGKAQIVQLPVTDYAKAQSISGVNASLLPIQFGSSENAYYVYMDQNVAPFNGSSGIYVRAAVTYALNYTGLINSVFGGHAVQWIGPIPPGFEYYNRSISSLTASELQYLKSQGYTSNVTSLTPYQYNPLAAAEYLHKAGYRAVFPNGTVIPGPNGSLPSINFLYDSSDPSQVIASQIIQQYLGSIGINVTLKPLTNTPYTSWIYGILGNTSDYPMGINFYTEDYSAAIDYVTNLASGDYNGTGYYNNTVFNWTVNASTSFNNTAVAQNMTYITYTMYTNYTMAWLYVPYLLQVHSTDVTGMIPNTAGSGAGYFMYYNTVEFT